MIKLWLLSRGLNRGARSGRNVKWKMENGKWKTCPAKPNGKVK